MYEIRRSNIGFFLYYRRGCSANFLSHPGFGFYAIDLVKIHCARVKSIISANNGPSLDQSNRIIIIIEKFYFLTLIRASSPVGTSQLSNTSTINPHNLFFIIIENDSKNLIILYCRCRKHKTMTKNSPFHPPRI